MDLATKYVKISVHALFYGLIRCNLWSVSSRLVCGHALFPDVSLAVLLHEPAHACPYGGALTLLGGGEQRVRHRHVRKPYRRCICQWYIHASFTVLCSDWVSQTEDAVWKMVLNMIITALMIKQGCVEDNRMVRMQQNNSKLINRNTRMLQNSLCRSPSASHHLR